MVIGSMGRQAMYSELGWNPAPLALRHMNNADQPLRDIDIITPRRPVKDEDWCGPHPIDLGLTLDIFDVTDYRSPALYGPRGDEEARRFPLHVEVIKRRRRSLGGAPIGTFLVGTHLLFEQLVAAREAYCHDDQAATAAYTPALEEFARFADSIRETHPNEFLPNELYQPFHDAIAAYRAAMPSDNTRSD